MGSPALSVSVSLTLSAYSENQARKEQDGPGRLTPSPPPNSSRAVGPSVYFGVCSLAVGLRISPHGQEA